MSIILTLFILGLIIFIHELGHFLAARLFKIPVSEFALGMGPKLLTFHGEATDYNLRLIPMGGFVNIQGMEFDKEDPDGFNSKKAWQRFIVLFAGVFMNFILAYFIVAASTIGGGEYTARKEAVIGKVMVGSKAEKILHVGDKILSINGKTINNWDDLSTVVQENRKEKALLKISRDGKEIEEEIGLTYSKERDLYLIGIEPVLDFRKYGLSEGIKMSGTNYIKVFTSVIDGFKMLVKGKVKAEEMTGPIGLVKVVSDVNRTNSEFLIWLTALLSINVGIFNLLPFPALDGGRIIFVLLEMFGIKISKKIEEKVHLIGIIILIGIFILITGNDIKKLF